MLEIVSDASINEAKILVIGVGGGGNNTVDRMIEKNVGGVEYMCINTDRQQLERCKTNNTLQIGVNVTKGLGAGAKPEVGRAAAEESKEEIMKAIEGVDMVFVTCGMGGGTGTGAAPIVAELAKSAGILTVGAVTKPFSYEGTVRKRNAEAGIAELSKYVDTLIVVPNDKLLAICDRKTNIRDALKKADTVLQQGIQGITDLITTPGLINLDFADVKSVMINKGRAHFGTGEGKGANKCLDAVKLAANSPLLETTIDHASHVIINFSGDVGLVEVGEATEYVQGLVGEDASIYFGCIPSDVADDTVKVTLIATGLGEKTSSFSFMKKAIQQSTEAEMPENEPVEPKTEEPLGIKIPEPVKATRTLNNIELPNFLKK